MTETAFVKHLLEYRSVHEAMVLALVGDPHAVEDLDQQAALIMTRKKDGVPDDGRFLPWSRKVIVKGIACAARSGYSHVKLPGALKWQDWSAPRTNLEVTWTHRNESWPWP